MRLALIRQRYTPYGGAERFIEGALEALLERNVAITLYTANGRRRTYSSWSPYLRPVLPGQPVARLGFARAVGPRHRRRRPTSCSRMRLLCCDIIAPGTVCMPSGSRALARRVALAVRVLANPWHHYTLHMEKKLFASPWLRSVICNSRMVREEIKARFGLPENRLPVIYNSVDSAAFHSDLREHRERLCGRYKIPLEATIFLLVGSGYERKGVATAIAALAELPEPAHLMVVGREKHLGPYKNLARTSASANDLLSRPAAGRQALLRMCRCLRPSDHLRSFPNAALEALACGLPVITTTKSGAASLWKITAPVSCAPRATSRMAAHMRALLDAETRERQGANARRAVEPLTPSAMTLKLVLLYKELLEESVKHKTAPRPPHAAPPTTTAASIATRPPQEAPMLHGETGLANESLPAAPVPDDKAPLL
jgi:UDP-glucose:(heptosyl)LPS alpha-1,3-glucosyltransferase